VSCGRRSTDRAFEMFSEFFYLLRAYGLKVSLNEWLTLMEALEQGLHHDSLLDFYYLCRMILVKSETDFDKFDRAFADYFQGVEHFDTLPKDVRDWLAAPGKRAEIDKANVDRQFAGMDLETIQQMLRERLLEQDERHDRGSHWVGTGGISLFGYGGYNPNGIRVEGEGHSRSALQVAGERRYQDFRGDATLDVRQFQLAFRKLRKLSTHNEGPKSELQLEETVRSTCENAGYLKLEFDRPRSNEVQLLLLFDSGGSMWPYARMCSHLFHSANQSHRFKELRTYYFHNCIYETLHTTPECNFEQTVSTEQLFRELSPNWKVLFVGDGEMAPSELLRAGGRNDFFHHNDQPGLYWIRRFVSRYPHLAWLNPLPEEQWAEAFGAQTIQILQQEVPMFPLSLNGLESALKRLMVAR